LISVLLGFTCHTPQLDEALKKIIEDILNKTTGKDFFEMFIFIFTNNLNSSLLSFIVGAFFGIFPLISVSLNGYLLGFVMERSIGLAGIGVVWKLFPHGIFELPAFFLAGALGLRLGATVISKIKMLISNKNKKGYLLGNFQKSAKVFIFIIIPLLLIAGIIETALIFFIK